ncbi:MAG: hypothetical protein GY754_30465 [bacterium]|nr:hypothetical protein [bacterium]
MKRFLSLSLLAVLAFSGCEAGLSSNGEGSEEDEQFSFSKMHSEIKALREEIERLKAASTVDAVSNLTARVESHTASIGGLQSAVSDNADLIVNLDGDLSGMSSTFSGVTRISDPNTGQPTIQFSGVNVQIVNGLGYTNSVNSNYSSAGTVNGLGNLVVGYNEARGSGSDKSGSHNIIVGREHNYSSYGGLVAGLGNTIIGKYSSVSGGRYNTASGELSSVSGGWYNTAGGDYSSVSGGNHNTAGGEASSVSGGGANTASGIQSGVSGGTNNNASGGYSTVSGGTFVTANGNYYHLP